MLTLRLQVSEVHFINELTAEGLRCALEAQLESVEARIEAGRARRQAAQVRRRARRSLGTTDTTTDYCCEY